MEDLTFAPSSSMADQLSFWDIKTDLWRIKGFRDGSNIREAFAHGRLDTAGAGWWQRQRCTWSCYISIPYITAHTALAKNTRERKETHHS